MNKISSALLQQCNAENCCMNEFVSLPDGGDAGFEEYFTHKAKEILTRKKIFSPLEQNMLMLAYPKPDCRELYCFERFFDSPTIVARKHAFRGCFAIDVSAYIGKENDEHFDKLMLYMHDKKDIVFLLFAYSDNVKQIDTMVDSIAQYGDIRKVCLPLPSEKQLTDYTVDKIRDFCLHVDKPVFAFLQSHYANKGVGFDYADYLVRTLKNRGYNGDLPAMQTAVNEVDAVCMGVGGRSSYGY